jgi:hypothetical protein
MEAFRSSVAPERSAASSVQVAPVLPASRRGQERVSASSEPACPTRACLTQTAPSAPQAASKRMAGAASAS